LIGASLVAVYVIWGGTFLAIRVALDSFPPLLMAAVRFIAAGVALFVVARVRGETLPTPRQWGACAALGVLFVASNAAVVYAEESVPSGVAAMVMATIPMWAALLGHLWSERTRGREWIGLALGLAGVALLHFGGALGASTFGALVLFAAPVAWAFGTIWSRHVSLPGGMMQSAAQMTIGGAVVLVASFARGERMTSLPSLAGVGALAYLVVFGSVIAFSAYNYLLREVRPSVATSYAYVNPVIALALGAALGGERVGATAMVALVVTLSGVILLAQARARPRNAATEPCISSSR
jgi:drug/metabolite transporter (DMT)-like permease